MCRPKNKQTDIENISKMVLFHRLALRQTENVRKLWSHHTN